MIVRQYSHLLSFSYLFFSLHKVDYDNTYSYDFKTINTINSYGANSSKTRVLCLEQNASNYVTSPEQV